MSLCYSFVASCLHSVLRWVIVFALCSPALAGPGAHGPGGEHLDQPTASNAAGSARPRMEAATELFELVARLGGGELSMLIDRFNTNEPVHDARVQVESGGIKADAKFHADNGDFSVDDPKLLAHLSKPGEHALVISVVAGNDSDLLNGTLVVSAAGAAAAAGTHTHANNNDHGHDHWWERPIWIGTTLLGLVLLAGIAWRRRKATTAHRGALLCLAVTGLLFAPAADAGPGAHGPGGEHLDAAGGASGGASGLARLPDGSVNVPKSAQRRMAIRTLVATASDAAATVELPGRIVVDPNASGHVQAVHGGRVEAGPKGLPVVGQRVQRGEVLAYVRHHAEPFALGNQQAQLAELRTQRQLAEQRVQRLEGLEGTVPRKEIEAARAEAQGLAARERSVGGSLATREALVAPVSGVVSRAELVNGRVVEPRDVLIEIIDPTRMLVEATTPDAGLVARIAGAHLQGASEAKLRLLGGARAMREGVLPLMFAVTGAKPGAALPLAIGQPVTVVASLNERVKGYVLPAQSVVRSPANEPTVWIKSGAERFIPQPVQFKPLDANTIVVTQGLGADNRVVVQGAPLIAQIR